MKTNTYKRLLALSGQKAGLMRVSLLNGITTFKKKISSEELERAIKSGDFSKVQRTIPWEEMPYSLEHAMGFVGETASAAGVISLEKLPPNFSERLRWDIKNPVIRSYINGRTGSLVKGIEADTKEVIQNFVARAFTETMSPRQIARQIKGSIGLFPAQEKALANYQRGLAGQGVTGPKLERMADAYESKLLDYRSMNIARTEVRGATNSGQLSVWREAANQDLFDRARAERVWIVEGANPCEDCLSMDGETTGLDEPWVMPDGTAVDCPPWDVHPQCECGQELQFNVFGTEKEIEEDNE